MTFHRTNFVRRRGFSLTEILIVIALIVLMLALALPAFNFISGGKSIDGAMNQISAFLSRARTEAVGLQEIRGVMFYVDPKTDRQMMVLVKETAHQNGDSAATDVYLDAEDLDHIPLPKGVAINLANDSQGATVDAYTGLNKYTFSNGDQSIRVGGVILFDGNGKLATLAYGLRMTMKDASNVPAATSMMKLIDPFFSTLPKDYDSTGAAPLKFPTSSFAFVLFDEGTMKDQSFGSDYASDSPYKTPPQSYGTDTDEKNEETWIEQNATAVTINRYNGTLVKGD